MPPIVHKAALADPLQYPYEPSDNNIIPYGDVFGREPNQLLASLAQYGHMVQVGNALLSNSNLDRNVALLTRFAEDSCLPSDFDTLLDMFPPTPFPKQHIFKSDILKLADSNAVKTLQSQLNNLPEYDQISFPCSISVDDWTVFVVFPKEAVIEVYCIGRVARINYYSPYTLKLSRVLNMAGFTQQFHVRHRFQLPVTLPVNFVVMTLILVREIHLRRKYLELNHEVIMQKKLLLMDAFVECHDEWLGKLIPSLDKNKSHPFLTTAFKGKDRFPELVEIGWKVIDVEGDGNCGFYSILLGLDNNNNRQYQPSQRSVPNSPIRENTAWQESVVLFRKDLQGHSDHLLTTVYTPDIRSSLNWYFLTTASNESEFEKLSLTFYTDQFTQQQYFDRTLTIKPKHNKKHQLDGTNYQMNPFWTGLVVSSMFNMRVIVYTRSASYDKDTKEVKHHWSTTTMNARLPVEQHIHQEVEKTNKIHRISDIEYNQMPTIEILYTTGFVKKNIPDSQHFQFLRRILCNNLPNPVHPSPETLRDLIQRGQQNSSTKTNTPVKQRTDKQSTSERQSKGTTTKVASKGKTMKTLLQGNKKPQQTPVPRKQPQAKTKLVREKKWLMEQLTESFNQQYVENTSKHKTSTKMKYDPMKNHYLTRLRGDDGKLQKQQICHDVTEYDQKLVDAAKSYPGQWVGPSVGDSGNGPAPIHLCVGIKTLYEQHGNPYCLAYSLASALFYCGLKNEAYELARQAPDFSNMHTMQVITSLKDLMANLVPVIGRPTLYGIRTACNKKKRTLTFDQLLNDVTEYPTVVVPSTSDVHGTHAFCVVDDLIFDSITPYALKLQRESVEWIFNGAAARIEYALRFKTKVSPPGVVIHGTYKHELTFNWDHPSQKRNH